MNDDFDNSKDDKAILAKLTGDSCVSMRQHKRHVSETARPAREVSSALVDSPNNWPTRVNAETLQRAEQHDTTQWDMNAEAFALLESAKRDIQKAMALLHP